MATWNDLRQYIYSHYQVTQEAPGVIRLIFNLGNGRTQNVLVSGKQAGSFDYFVIWTPICHEGQISARDAMVRNTALTNPARAESNSRPACSTVVETAA